MATTPPKQRIAWTSKCHDSGERAPDHSKAYQEYSQICPSLAFLAQFCLITRLCHFIPSWHPSHHQHICPLHGDDSRTVVRILPSRGQSVFADLFLVKLKEVIEKNEDKLTQRLASIAHSGSKCQS